MPFESSLCRLADGEAEAMMDVYSLVQIGYSLVQIGTLTEPDVRIWLSDFTAAA
ncbi:hypothetical protein [Sutterella wadsworthensis]|uniref:hypothetical protein n=1 Tax=Sutterella wadsworthensis TaxID=40545 RepID=UPI000A6CA7A3|nr:hypothetical protein [Sutterella wadsworthensis]